MVSLLYYVHKCKATVILQYVVQLIAIAVAFQVSTQATGYVLYVSKARGLDEANSCRNITPPCQTLNHVIKMATGGDLIMMDATSTEMIPYNTCSTWEISGNLSFYSWNGLAVINCSGNALHFDGNSTSATLAFQGLTFLDTFLRVYEASLTINNCSFGSLIQNATFPYLIYVTINKPPDNFRTEITSTNFFENNTVGALNVVNNQFVKVFVEIRNITVANSYLENAKYIIFIQGNVDFNFTNSEISKTKFSEKILSPSLIYFYGCPVENKHEDGKRNSRLSRKRSRHGRVGYKKHGHESTVFYDDSTAIFSIKGLNFSWNYVRIAETLFCTRGNVSIIDTITLNNFNLLWPGGGSIVMDTKYNVTRLDILLENNSFVSNINDDTVPVVSVVSENITLLVKNCTFSYNQAGAIYVATSPNSNITIRNTSVQFSKSFANVVSHCAAQVCVMFRFLHESVKGWDSFDWLSKKIEKSTKLWKDGFTESKEAAFMESGIDEPTNFRSKAGFSGTGAKSDQSPFSNKGAESFLYAINTLGLKTKNKVADSENSRFLKKVKSILMGNNKSSKFDSKGHFEKRNAGNSELLTLSTREYGQFESGLLIEDCQFRNNTADFAINGIVEVNSELYIGLGGDSIAHVLVRRCVFNGNLAQSGTGALYLAGNMNVTITNSTFHNNAGFTSGAIHLSGTTLVMQNCTLDSNSGGLGGYTQATGSVRLTKQGTALIQDSRIIQRNIVQNFAYKGLYHSSLALSSDSFDKIILSNSVIECQWSPSLEKVVVLEIAHTKPFVLDEGTSIECPLGYGIKRTTISDSGQSFECDLCMMGTYSVDRGIYRYNSSNSVKCLLCPYGARCTKGLEALPNFWGYKIQNNPTTIQFSRCPMGYCCQAEGKDKGCVPYDTCNIGRYGRLCGRCRPGFTETLFTASCRKSEKCNDYWFWPTAVIFVLGFALYLIVDPDIPATLYRSITWFRSKPTQVAEPDSTSQSGMERIVFFYYQAIDILTVQGSNNMVWDKHFTLLIVGIFSFDVRLNQEGFACPFPGLNPVSKLLFRTLGVFSVLFAIPFIFLLHKAMTLCFPIRSAKSGIYLSAFLKCVFLGYTVLARNSLPLLHCVTVDGVNCLFVDCNIECYTWWQKLIGTLVLIYFVPFVLVLFFGAKKLYGRHITVVHFFFACLFPLPFLSYWFLNRRYLGEEMVPDTGGLTAITSTLIGSYRIPDHISRGVIYWESVMLGRMLLLILIAVLVKDPFLSALGLLLLCVINLSLHIYVLPFERTLHNRAESISLFCLVLMAMFNLPFMAYLSEGVQPTGPMSQVMDVFMWCQVVLVGFLPFICVFLLFIAIFSQFVRLMFFLSKGIGFAFTCLASCRCFSRNRPRGELDDPLM